MKLSLPRFCNAVMAWIRSHNLNGTEEGVARWQAFKAWVDAEPRGRLLPQTAVHTGGPGDGKTPEQMRAEAEAAVRNNDAAFAAYGIN